MRSTKSVSVAIFEVEGFEVRFVGLDGEDVSQRRVEDYPYQRAARGAWTVANWKRERFETTYPGFTVDVLGPDGEPVHGKTLIENLRYRWLEEDNGEDGGEDAPPPEVNPGPKATTTVAAGRAPGQQDIESWLWEAANILRGPVDPANLRDFVFPLLFLKRLSDQWDEEQARAVAKFGPNIDDDISADFHAFSIPQGCHWADLRRTAENHGVVLQQIMQRIEEANPEKLAQIFGNAPWADPNKMPGERLERLIEHFSQRDLRPSVVSNDLLGGGYEYLLKRFSDESATSAGQFFTPRAVVHLLVRILEPKPTDSVYDPACGSAGMLIEAANEVVQSGGSVAQMRFYGQEVNQTSAAIGRMNLLIHEVEDAQIKREDTLRNPLFRDARGQLTRFDMLVVNPPFSLKNWGAESWANDSHRRAIGGVPPRGNGDFAWIQHMIASMKPETGRIGVVMPHGVLFRGGAEGVIRQHLVERDLLDAVVGLAPNLFYGTSIPACLLFFRAQKPDNRQGHVLFIDGSKRFTKGKNQNELSESDVTDLYQAYLTNGGKCAPGIQVDRVSHEVIESNGWDLNIGRYIRTVSSEVVDVRQLLDELHKARLALSQAESDMLQRLQAAGYE